MNKKAYGALAGLLLMAMSSCSDDNPWLEELGQGAIKLSLTADGNITDAIPETRAGDSEYFEIPGSEKFYIHLFRDGNLHTNLTHDEFIKKESFPTGSYVMKAFSGSLENEGYDVEPYFEGTVNVDVFEGRTTETHVTATLGHTLISVDYTDNFRKYMKTYSSKLNSEGHSYIDVDESKDGPIFLVPGEVSAWINFTDPQGRELTLLPAQFEAKAAHHYQIRFDVNGGQVATPQLKISFVTELEEETVTIDLTDELFMAQAPEVVPFNFEDKEEITFLSGTPAENSYRFNVLSYGGLNSVKLTLNRTEGNGESLPFTGEIELLKASEADQAKVQAAGFDCKGLFRNPDKMAYIDFSGVAEKLPAGKYEISVIATDLFTRASDPITVYVTSKDARINAEGLKANPATHEGTLLITYNGGNPELITFKAGNEYGMLVDAKVLKIEDISTKAFEDIQYRFTIQLPDFGSRTEEEVAIYLNNKHVETVMLPVVTSFDVDAFAKKVMFKVIAPKNKITDAAANAVIEIKDADGNVVMGLTETRNTNNDIITFTGLTPSTHYTYTITGYEGEETYNGEFTTEDIINLPNAEFTEMDDQIYIDRINAGGIYRYSALLIQGLYRNKTSILIHTPNEWGNINDITCDYDGSTNKNTWYVVPSTLGDSINYTVTIRTVGYNHNGKEVPEFTTTTYNYYSQNAPEPEDFMVAAGQLFLGKNVDKKKEFQSRPASLAFEYSYNPLNDEKAKVEIKVYSNEDIIGTGSLEFDKGSEKTVPIQYSPDSFGKKATHLSVIFYSSAANTPAINIPKGTDLRDNTSRSPSSSVTDRMNPDVNGEILATNQYYSKATGSELTIDNVKLNY